MKTAAIVISHYNAWPTDQLVALLDQIQSIPAGYPFQTRVVVNRAEEKTLELPSRHVDVAISYRENTGFNIGAWDHGWRQPPPADFYLFFQEECVIQRAGWLKAFIGAASRPGVGMVGEVLGVPSMTWEDLDFWMASADPSFFDGEPVSYPTFVKKHLARFGIEPGPMAEHLQSLILCTRRDVLEKIGGFRIGQTKDEAICAEFGISKSVEAIGLRTRLVGFRPFTYIHHPQWDEDRSKSRKLGWMIRRAVELYLPGGVTRFRRSLGKRKSNVSS